jgi:uncharacterized glyoxalase superfamily protein PhnB
MSVQPIPAGYNTVTPYLIVNDAERLVRFLEQAFGARTTLDPFRDADGRIMHAEMQVGNSRIMLANASEKWPAMPASIFLYVKDCDASYSNAVAAGGKSLMEPADQFHGDRMGGVQDDSGCQWWIATRIEDVSPEEMERRKEAYLASVAGAAS